MQINLISAACVQKGKFKNWVNVDMFWINNARSWINYTSNVYSNAIPWTIFFKRFTGKNKLDSHMSSVHYKDNPNACRYGCGRAYNDISNRNQHERKSKFVNPHIYNMYNCLLRYRFQPMEDFTYRLSRPWKRLIILISQMDWKIINDRVLPTEPKLKEWLRRPPLLNLPL